MASVTLYYGMPDGPQMSFNAIGCDFADLDAGTDYTVDFTQTYSIGDDECKTVSINILGPGIAKIGGLSSGTKLLPDAAYALADGVYSIDCRFETVPIGVQPADWDARWKDIYYTRTVHTVGDDTAHIYTKASASWSAVTQYYKSTDMSRLYFTQNGSMFGVGRNQSGTVTVSTDCGVLMLGLYGDPNTEQASNPFRPMWQGSNGQCIIAGTSYQAPAYRVPVTQNYINTFNVAAQYRTNFYMISCTYNGEQYGGVAMADFDVYGQCTGIGMYLIGKAFFAGSVNPSEPGDWGGSSGPHAPTSRTSVPFSSGNGLTPIPSGIQTVGWRLPGSSGGLNIYLSNDYEYAQLIADSWATDLFETIINRGWRPTDYILSAMRVPDGFITNANGEYMSLGGKQTRATGYVPLERVYTVDCGYVTIPAPRDNFADYDTSAELYLPFIGTVPLDVSKVLRSTLTLEYRVDLVTGDCIAILQNTPQYPDTYSGEFNTANTVLLTASGHCGFEIPISRTDGGTNQKLAGMTSAITAALSAITGNAAGFAGSLSALINSGKMGVSASGLSGGSAAFGHLTPYIWLKYPYDINPSAYTETVGRPAAMGGTVGSVITDDPDNPIPLEGYQQYSSVDLSGLDASDEEKAMLERLLKEGVYL